MAMLGILLVSVLGWAYWKTVSHGALHVSLDDVALKTDRLLWASVLEADVTFQDSDGTALATGKADKPYGIVRMMHPDVGNCRPEEDQGGLAWQRCFQAQSRWLPTWVSRVHDARVRVAECTIAHVPVERDVSRGLWWLFWVPAPHLDNSLYTSYQLSMLIDSAQCRAANR